MTFRLSGCSPLRFAPGGTRELRSSLLILPPLRCGENQEFEQMPLRGTAQLARYVLEDQPKTSFNRVLYEINSFCNNICEVKRDT